MNMDMKNVNQFDWKSMDNFDRNTMINLLLDWRSLFSLLASLMFLRTAVRECIPGEVYQAYDWVKGYFFSYLESKIVTIEIREFDGNSHSHNEIFNSVQRYLSSLCFSSAHHFTLSRIKNSKQVTYAMVPDQSLVDIYEGNKFTWSYHVPEMTVPYFKLIFNSKLKEVVNSSYLSHITKEAEAIKFNNRAKKLYTNRSHECHWSQVAHFNHPSTFETIAMDPILKEEIKEDLMKFVERSKFYTKVGRAWKRGYLLYGPPGTGKTSLIAAIANFLKFDIYDLELTNVKSNSELRSLLISTASKAVIVIEDIDCSLDLTNRKKKKKIGNKSSNDNGSSISLSGVLNFVDGLWSSCGSERLIIFTTNHKEKLDPALLRPGRMDKHINLSYCDFESFKILARNYLGLEEHVIMKEVEELIGLVKMTPADVAEYFMTCTCFEDAEICLRNVVEEMEKRFTLQSIKQEVEEKKEENEDKMVDEKNEYEDKEVDKNTGDEDEDDDDDDTEGNYDGGHHYDDDSSGSYDGGDHCEDDSSVSYDDEDYYGSS